MNRCEVPSGLVGDDLQLVQDGMEGLVSICALHSTRRVFRNVENPEPGTEWRRAVVDDNRQQLEPLVVRLMGRNAALGRCGIARDFSLRSRDFGMTSTVGVRSDKLPVPNLWRYCCPGVVAPHEVLSGSADAVEQT